MTNAKFREVVRFRQYDLLFALCSLLLAGLVLSYSFLMMTEVPLGRLAVASLVSVGLALYIGQLLFANHRIRVTRKKLKVDQDSLISQKARIRLDEISSVELVRHPLYAQRYGHGGWLSGERYLSLTGRNGLKIETNSGERYFIGSRRAKELKRAILMAA